MRVDDGMTRVDINLYSQGEPDRWVYSTCNLCSNGCGLHIAVKGNRIVGVRGNADYPVNRGRLAPIGEEHGTRTTALIA